MTETISNTPEATTKTTYTPFVSVLDNKKVIVDTSSLLIAGTRLLGDLPECELIIPSVVLMELDEKRTHSTLGFLARQWLRLIDELRVSKKGLLREGVAVPGNEHVMLRIEPNHTNQESLPPHLRDGTNDKTILAVAANFRNEERDMYVSKEREKEGADGAIAEFGDDGFFNIVTEGVDFGVAVLSNDTPVKIHADLDLGIEATGYDYASVNKVQPFSGVVNVSITNEETQHIYSHAEGNKYAHSLPVSVLEKIDEQTQDTTHCVIRLLLEYSGDDADQVDRDVAALLKRGNTIEDIDLDVFASGVEGRTIQQTVALNYLTERASTLPIVSLGGSAGTGKTLLALAAGIDGVNAEMYEKVIAFRSLHEMGDGQELGFLPGDANDKMRPWAGAIYDALSAISKQGKKKSGGSSEHVHTAEDTVAKFKDIIEVSPITYLRGRSLSNAYIIIEEAQNFSFSELLNILSRVGQDSKVVLTFDAAQVDNKFLSSGDKADVWSVVDRLKRSEVFAHVTLAKTERSRVAEIASRALEGKSF